MTVVPSLASQSCEIAARRLIFEPYETLSPKGDNIKDNYFSRREIKELINSFGPDINRGGGARSVDWQSSRVESSCVIIFHDQLLLLLRSSSGIYFERFV